MSEIVQADSPTLAESYSECVNSFGKFVLALGEPDCDAICRDQVRFPQIYEEFGRIRIWGDQSKADLLASARGSLDDRLRQDSNLKLLVLGILQRLKLLLWQATHIAQRKYDVGGDVDHGSVSSVTDSDYSTDDEDESQRRTMPKIRLLVQHIADQIRSLHEISSLLRRPTVTNKSIHSINTGVEEITLQGSDHVPLNRAFEVFDNNHILEKVLQWRGLSKSLRHITFSEENVAPASNVSSYQEVEGIRWLCERLAKANTRRREQLQYRKHHPYNSKQIVANAKLIGDLAAHMENLSLFVLPAPENHENEKPEGSINSHKADLCDLNNFSTGPVSETGSLGFSAAESHSQPPAESASIPAHKEVEYTFKSSTREATDEDDTLTPTVRSQTEADIDEFMELKRTLQRSMRSADWEDSFATMIEQTSEFQKRKMALGLDHPDTLESMHALAFTYRCNGRLNKAGSLLAQVVQLRTMVLGPEHLDTLNSMESLASMYGKRGRFRAAKALYSNVLESYERSLGLKNALAINVVERLGRIYVEEGQLQEATFMYERTLRHCKKGLELGDPAVLALASKLKRLYISQGRFQDAKAIH
ncbi:hypothetical protein NUW58_g2713 [Xylaria curta]|uniref:Uncharacterized protein n=1 Tax=Xylaria curta TaxID=42375 RepID=A0ACC1PG35_9PEZI|nr:hypothetical protein NUW58_g2713 [Xylaria curta]